MIGRAAGGTIHLLFLSRHVIFFFNAANLPTLSLHSLTLCRCAADHVRLAMKMLLKRAAPSRSVTFAFEKPGGTGPCACFG